jgi:hypothetical protein
MSGGRLASEVFETGVQAVWKPSYHVYEEDRCVLPKRKRAYISKTLCHKSLGYLITKTHNK